MRCQQRPRMSASCPMSAYPDLFKSQVTQHFFIRNLPFKSWGVETEGSRCQASNSNSMRHCTSRNKSNFARQFWDLFRALSTSIRVMLAQLRRLISLLACFSNRAAWAGLNNPRPASSRCDCGSWKGESRAESLEIQNKNCNFTIFDSFSSFFKAAKGELAKWIAIAKMKDWIATRTDIAQVLLFCTALEKSPWKCSLFSQLGLRHWHQIIQSLW